MKVLHHAERVRRSAWLRIQETPFELAIAVLAMYSAITLLATDLSKLAGWVICTSIFLILGGICIASGRFTGWLQLESAGLTFFTASMIFVTLYDLQFAITPSEYAQVIASTGALTLAGLIRLYTVRHTLYLERRILRDRT